LIGTLAYAARIAGVRTRRIAISFSLFNILILVSRTSNSFQGPFLAKRIEKNIALGASHGLLADFRWMLWSATIATIVGAILIPTFQRLFSRAVLDFQQNRSMPRLLLRIFFKGGLAQHGYFSGIYQETRERERREPVSLRSSRLCSTS